MQVVETVGWTNGSLHMKMERQSWVVSNMLDVFGVLLTGVLLLLALLVWLVVAASRLAARWARSRRKGAKQL